jgi:hypothetical protein
VFDDDQGVTGLFKNVLELKRLRKPGGFSRFMKLKKGF